MPEGLRLRALLRLSDARLNFPISERDALRLLQSRTIGEALSYLRRVRDSSVTPSVPGDFFEYVRLRVGRYWT